MYWNEETSTFTRAFVICCIRARGLNTQIRVLNKMANLFDISAMCVNSLLKSKKSPCLSRHFHSLRLVIAIAYVYERIEYDWNCSKKEGTKTQTRSRFCFAIPSSSESPGKWMGRHLELFFFRQKCQPIEGTKILQLFTALGSTFQLLALKFELMNCNKQSNGFRFSGPITASEEKMKIEPFFYFLNGPCKVK